MKPRRTLLKAGGGLVAGLAGCLRMDNPESSGDVEADDAATPTGSAPADQEGTPDDDDGVHDGDDDVSDDDVPDDGGGALVARYRFEGDLTDETGRYDLSGTGVSYTGDAPEGGTAATWSGAYAEGGIYSVGPDEPVTFCFWLRDSSTRSAWDDDLLWKVSSDEEGVGSFCARDGEVFLWTSGENTRGKSDADVLDGRWHHVAFVLEPSKRRMRLYVDGDQEYDVRYEDRIRHAGRTKLKVGNRSRNGHKQYDGGLDDLRIYTRALSAAEIRSIVNRE